MYVGEKIRKIRTLKGLSQDSIARSLSISQVAYSDIENNKSQITLNRLEKIGTILGMEVQDILTFDDKQIFNNTFKDSSKGFFNVEKVINEAFCNERKAYIDQIKFLKEEIVYLRSLNK